MLTGLFDIALNGIKVAQIGLEVTGNNVANVETPGFTRRTPVIDQLVHYKGATVRFIKREYSIFVADSLQDALSPLGYYEVKDQLLTELESIFNEISSGGIKEALSQFWNSWEMLADDPASLSIREVLLQNAKVLTENFHLKKEQLLNLRSYIKPEIESLVEEVNNLIERLSDLNVKIRFGSVAKKDINDLLDEKDRIIRKLSEYIGASSIRDKNDQTILILAGQVLVTGGESFKLSVRTDEKGNIRIMWNGEIDITERIMSLKKGKLSAYLEVRDEILPEYIQKIDDLARYLAEKINEKHKSGYDLYGNLGEDFFLFDPTNPAGTIALNITDPKKIAASDSSDSLPSNNKNALAIANLKDEKIPELSDYTFNEFYNNIVVTIGNIVKNNRSFLKLQSQTVESIMKEFESISGVNLDEEAANTLKFQYLYTASAKLITVADRITETIINMGA